MKESTIRTQLKQEGKYDKNIIYCEKESIIKEKFKWGKLLWKGKYLEGKYLP